MNVNINQSETIGSCRKTFTSSCASLLFFLNGKVHISVTRHIKCRTETCLLTKLRNDNAAPMFTMVGTIPNFPAYKINDKRTSLVLLKKKRTHTHIMMSWKLQDLFRPHSSKDNDVEPDPVCFDQASCLPSISVLVVFCKPKTSVLLFISFIQELLF